MGANYRSYVGHAAVADFDRSSVEDFVEFIVLGEMFINQLQKFPTDIGFDGSAVRGIEPCHISGSLASSRVRVLELKLVRMAASLQRLLIISLRFVEYRFT